MTDISPIFRSVLAGLCAAVLGLLAPPALAQGPVRSGDYIVAVVNQELVTAAEVQARLARVTEDAARSKTPLPEPALLRQQILESLIDDRVLITNARETGPRIDEAELDRAVASVALQNQLTLTQLRERLRGEGIDYVKFRSNIRDQMQVERVREREVLNRIKVSDAEIDAYLAAHRAAVAGNVELNLAQILVTVPEGASDAVVAERRAIAEAARTRVRAGEDFATVAREVSEDGNRAAGGEIGLRPADRLPDVFTQAVRTVRDGEVAPELLRSGAGFHLLKVLERRDVDTTVEQTRARHILLRISAELSAEAAARRLAEFKRAIVNGTQTFEQVARQNSEDSSAPVGGDLGWASPGTFVAEFEEAMNALPIGGLSDPVATRFGVHLIQVIERRRAAIDRRQQREQARNVLREQKFEEAYIEWIRDLRGRAYIELRDPPQP